MVGLIHHLITVMLLALLLFGLVQSKKHSFKGGVYSFLLLFILKIYSLFAPFIVRTIVDYYYVNNFSPPFSMQISELVALLQLLPKMLQLIAFTILIIGLYKIWKK